MSAPEGRFLDLLCLAAGKSEVPQQYFLWSGISLLAAALNDRVWYEKWRGKRLYPNLYVMITGASGAGKDSAIDFASQFAAKIKGIHEYYGKVSGAGLADVLARPDARRASAENRPTVWLVLPELANSIGKGALADDFVKRLTALSEGKDKRYQEITRGLMREGNELSYESPLINCLLGSTQNWLVDCVTAEAISSGFFARMFVINGEWDPSVRIYKPMFPDNYDELVDELRTRLKAITRLGGCFYLTKQADKIRETWYNSRPVPSDRRLWPNWKRLDDMILKLAMVLSPAVQVGYEKLVITSEAIVEAQRLATDAFGGLPSILKWAARSGKTSDMEKIADLITQAASIPHSALLKKAAHHGIHAKELKDLVTILVDRGDVRRVRNHNGGVVYEDRKALR